MRAYPKHYRQEVGDELVFTANELAIGRRVEFARTLAVDR